MDLQRRKVVIIGAGHVGSHVGYALVAQSLVEEIVYIDVDRGKAEAQALDIFDSTNYQPRRVIVRAGDYSDAKDADLMFIAAGRLPDRVHGEDRMDTLGATIEVMKDIVKNIKASGFSGIIISISNPADVIAHYIQHQLDYPPRRIMSTSTTLDSSRLRRAISEQIGIDQKSIVAYALGEHGESQMVPWSMVSIGGKPLSELRAERPDTYGKLDLKQIVEKVKAGGWDILLGKGSTEFGIGAAAAEVVRAIVADENRVLSVSALLDGQYGQSGVYASVPCVVNKNGVADIIELKLTESELAEFAASCKEMKENFQKALSL
jgi:L-lactate dehydrogenase